MLSKAPIGRPCGRIVSESFGFALIAALILISASSRASAQDTAAIRLGSAVSVRTCDELVIDVLADTAIAATVGGYQAFVSYPANLVTPLRFEPAAVDATVFVSGIDEPMQPCFDEDVSALIGIAGSVYKEGIDDDNVPSTANGIVLGQLIFAPVEAADAASFSLYSSECPFPWDRTTRVYDGAGNGVETTQGEAISVELIDAGVVFTDLTCEFTPGNNVRLAWPSLETAPDGFRVYRNDALLSELAGDVVEFVDGDPLNDEDAIYRVAPVTEGEDGCSAECSFSFDGQFIRGDVDGDWLLSITDGVSVLQYLFQAGSLDCLESADANGDTTVNLSDALFLLNFLFRTGALPPAPFPAPGRPETSGLGCERAGLPAA